MSDIREMSDTLDEEELYNLECDQKRKKGPRVLKSGKKSGRYQKRAGKSFEYRVAGYISKFDKWWAKRVPSDLGRHSLVEGKHDVIAKFSRKIYHVECKKALIDNEMNIKQDWLDKIDFDTLREVLCIGFPRSMIYGCLPQREYIQYFGDNKIHSKCPLHTGRGKKQMKIEKDWFVDDYLKIKFNDCIYVFFPFENYLTQKINE